MAGDPRLRTRFKLLGICIVLMIVVGLLFYAYLAIVPHDVTTTLEGYQPPSGDYMIQGKGQQVG